MAIKGITAKYRDEKPIALLNDILIYGFEIDNNRDLNIVISCNDRFRANRVFKDKHGEPYFVHYDKKYYISNARSIK